VAILAFVLRLIKINTIISVVKVLHPDGSGRCHDIWRQVAREVLTRLRMGGYNLSIDDYGTRTLGEAHAGLRTGV
jgi:hypothetical protein